jgi:hypothetical protein
VEEALRMSERGRADSGFIKSAPVSTPLHLASKVPGVPSSAPNAFQGRVGCVAGAKLSAQDWARAGILAHFGVCSVHVLALTRRREVREMRSHPRGLRRNEA